MDTTEASAASAVPAPPNLLRQPDFLKLWTAQTISQFGTQVSNLAIPVVAITLLNASTFEIGLLNVMDFLPFLLIGLVAGVWVDRLRRRPILIVGDLGRAALLLSIPIAWGLGALTIVQLYAVGFLVGCLTVFFDVAYQSYLPSLVGPEHLVDGNGKLEISRAAAQVVGPGLGGILIGLLQAPVAIVADVVSYVGSAGFVFLIRRHEPSPAGEAAGADGPRPGLRAEMTEGLRYVVTHRHLRSIAACTASSNFFSNMGFAVLMVFALRELGMSVAAVGIAFSIGSLGALLGAFGSSRVAARLGVGPTIVVTASLSGPPLLLFALVPASAAPGVMVGVLVARGLHRGARHGRLQRQPGELSAGHHPATPAGPDERIDALVRVGHDPDRRADRWRARDADRRA